MNRDPSQYNEASERPDMAAIDKLPEIIREIISDNWNRELPRTEVGFVRQCSQLTAVALVALLREGRLSAVMGDACSDKSFAAFIVAEVINSENPRLTAHCCDIVFSLGESCRSQENLAKEYGMTRANVSNICTSIKDNYTGKPGSGMKSNVAVRKYKAGRIGKAAKSGEPFKYLDRIALKLAI